MPQILSNQLVSACEQAIRCVRKTGEDTKGELLDSIYLATKKILSLPALRLVMGRIQTEPQLGASQLLSSIDSSVEEPFGARRLLPISDWEEPRESISLPSGDLGGQTEKISYDAIVQKLQEAFSGFCPPATTIQFRRLQLVEQQWLKNALRNLLRPGGPLERVKPDGLYTPLSRALLATLNIRTDRSFLFCLAKDIDSGHTKESYVSIENETSPPDSAMPEASAREYLNASPTSVSASSPTSGVSAQNSFVSANKSIQQNIDLWSPKKRKFYEEAVQKLQEAFLGFRPPAEPLQFSQLSAMERGLLKKELQTFLRPGGAFKQIVQNGAYKTFSKAIKTLSEAIFATLKIKISLKSLYNCTRDGSCEEQSLAPTENGEAAVRQRSFSFPVSFSFPSLSAIVQKAFFGFRCPLKPTPITELWKGEQKLIKEKLGDLLSYQLTVLKQKGDYQELIQAIRSVICVEVSESFLTDLGAPNEHLVSAREPKELPPESKQAQEEGAEEPRIWKRKGELSLVNPASKKQAIESRNGFSSSSSGAFRDLSLSINTGLTPTERPNLYQQNSPSDDELDEQVRMILACIPPYEGEHPTQFRLCSREDKEELHRCRSKLKTLEKPGRLSASISRVLNVAISESFFCHFRDRQEVTRPDLNLRGPSGSFEQPLVPAVLFQPIPAITLQTMFARLPPHVLNTEPTPIERPIPSEVRSDKPPINRRPELRSVDDVDKRVKAGFAGIPRFQGSKPICFKNWDKESKKKFRSCLLKLNDEEKTHYLRESIKRVLNVAVSNNVLFDYERSRLGKKRSLKRDDVLETPAKRPLDFPDTKRRIKRARLEPLDAPDISGSGASSPMEVDQEEGPKQNGHLFEVEEFIKKNFTYSKYAIPYKESVFKRVRTIPNFWLEKRLEKQYPPSEAFGIRKINDKMGHGLFAKREFKEEERLGEYAGIIQPGTSGSSESRYQVSLANKRVPKDPFKNWVIEAEKTRNEFAYANHSDRPNCFIYIEYDLEGPHVIIEALRPIKAGEEITYDYGKKTYWDVLGETPEPR